MLLVPLLFRGLIAGAFSLATGPAAFPGGNTALGPEGLAPLPFTARNDGAESIGCGVTTAHWYAVDLGTAVPGASVHHTFWAMPGTGEVFVLNARGDRLPVQELWCGLAERSWETRAVIPLARHAGEPPAPIDLACRAEGGRLRCTPREAAPE